MAPVDFKPELNKPQPPAEYCVVSYPAPGVLLVRLNRPKELNCINMDGHAELDAIWQWMDEEPNLSVGIVTGTGRAFCAGADLKEWNTSNSKGRRRTTMPPSGFGAISRRTGRKPIIAAVNGIAFGGGTELIVNCDLVVASRKATFALPEVKRGVVAFAGALPRIVRTIGRQRAMEMALTGRTVPADEAYQWGLVNKVVGDGEGEVVAAAVDYAKMIAENSPDAVIIATTSFPRLLAANNMSSYSIGSLKYISRDQLAEYIRTKKPGVSVIDVRDSDYIGGHIMGCQNVPVHTHDFKMPELARTLADQEAVIFHCSLSQQRGPKSALNYLRERERMGMTKDGGDERQKVYVLEGGFSKWQEAYGEDKELTEAYVKDLWE
ncbi:ClpP/crotonase [Hortaea werneckii]|nr:ClpP/crotonase [Hortaea werneckii]